MPFTMTYVIARERIQKPAWRKPEIYLTDLEKFQMFRIIMVTERNKSCFSNSAFVLRDGSENVGQSPPINGVPPMKSENSLQYLIRKTNRDRHLSFDPSITKEKRVNRRTTGSRFNRHEKNIIRRQFSL